MMKRKGIILTMLVIILSLTANGQAKSGFDYFKGKWDVVADSPYGEVKFIVEFGKKDNNVISAIKDSEGKELYEVVKTSVGENRATIRFNGSQGEVAMVLTRKDEDKVTGDIMEGMVPVYGDRVK